MSEPINYRFDTDFDRMISEKVLQWRPWVGKNYALSNPLRLLLVGESHYYKTDQKKAKDEEEGSEHTRNVLLYVNNPTYNRIHELFLRSMQVSETPLWSNIAFYNFIQELMDWRNGRTSPTPRQFIEAWRLFPRVLGILNPTHCIFLGVSAFSEFGNAMRDCGYLAEPVETHEIAEAGTARTSSLTFQGQRLPIIAIAHPSAWRGDACTAYREFLETQCKDLMDTFTTE